MPLRPRPRRLAVLAAALASAVLAACAASPASAPAGEGGWLDPSDPIPGGPSGAWPRTPNAEAARRPVERQSMSPGDLRVFGADPDHRYLGCLTCAPDHGESVLNPKGRFGRCDPSRLGPGEASLLCRDAMPDFGSAEWTAGLSACNPQAETPPILLDGEGYFRGHLGLAARPRRTESVCDPRSRASSPSACAALQSICQPGAGPDATVAAPAAPPRPGSLRAETCLVRTDDGVEFLLSCRSFKAACRKERCDVGAGDRLFAPPLPVRPFDPLTGPLEPWRACYADCRVLGR